MPRSRSPMDAARRFRRPACTTVLRLNALLFAFTPVCVTNPMGRRAGRRGRSNGSCGTCCGSLSRSRGNARSGSCSHRENWTSSSRSCPHCRETCRHGARQLEEKWNGPHIHSCYWSLCIRPHLCCCNCLSTPRCNCSQVPSILFQSACASLHPE